MSFDSVPPHDLSDRVRSPRRRCVDGAPGGSDGGGLFGVRAGAQTVDAWLFSPGVGGRVEPWALEMGFSPPQ